MEILKIKNITFKDKDNTILDNISLSIKKGECISIVGESGSGKSTILRLCADLISPSAGSIEYNNKNLKNTNNTSIKYMEVLFWKKIY